MNKKKGLIFDLDGTLIDSIHDIQDSMNAVLSANGYPTHSKEEYRSFIGNGVDMLVKRALYPQEDPMVFQKIKQEYTAYYGAHSDCKTKPFDGIAKQLSSLKDEYRLAILSNKGDKDVKKLAVLYFGNGTFDLAYGQFGSYPVKPSPDLALLIADEWGLPHKDILFIGDSPEDVMTGKAAGMKTLGVLWGYRNEDQLLAAGCDGICKTPDELAKGVRKIL